MKTRLLILAATALLAACGGGAQQKTAQTTTTPDMHTAETSLDYVGTYKATLPAADCPGIEVTLTLRADGTYSEHDKYIGREVEFDETGAYRVEGNMLLLTPAESDNPIYYKVEENRLLRLDGDKQVVTGPMADNFIFTKCAE